MHIPVCHLDVFTDRPLGGIATVVCPLESWLSDQFLLEMAAEHGGPETVFFVGDHGEYELRWFTDRGEVGLSAPGAAGAAFVVFNYLEREIQHASFISKDGPIRARRNGEGVSIDVPGHPPVPMLRGVDLAPILRVAPKETLVMAANIHVAVFEDIEALATLDPDMERLRALERGVVVATAPGADGEAVVRPVSADANYFAQAARGACWASLAAYWADRLGRDVVTLRRDDGRGGRVTCERAGDRVIMEADVRRYMEGVIYL